MRRSSRGSGHVKKSERSFLCMTSAIPSLLCKICTLANRGCTWLKPQLGVRFGKNALHERDFCDSRLRKPVPPTRPAALAWTARCNTPKCAACSVTMMGVSESVAPRKRMIFGWRKRLIASISSLTRSITRARIAWKMLIDGHIPKTLGFHSQQQCAAMRYLSFEIVLHP